MTFLFVQLCSASCYFLHCRSKYSSHHPVLSHPQFVLVRQCENQVPHSQKRVGRNKSTNNSGFSRESFWPCLAHIGTVSRHFFTGLKKKTGFFHLRCHAQSPAGVTTQARMGLFVIDRATEIRVLTNRDAEAKCMFLILNDTQVAASCRFQPVSLAKQFGIRQSEDQKH